MIGDHNDDDEHGFVFDGVVVMTMIGASLVLISEAGAHTLRVRYQRDEGRPPCPHLFSPTTYCLPV
ncbi:hypothetical protein Syun_005681 [Stephania yunnanensis]|uniref:Uncharacterized protein n=1 Tax=Stephania yunnanensis TaxID=152371 RepID=A0AAP0L8W6_9MAGN